jgi:hypothetical protein
MSLSQQFVILTALTNVVLAETKASTYHISSEAPLLLWLVAGLAIIVLCSLHGIVIIGVYVNRATRKAVVQNYASLPPEQQKETLISERAERIRTGLDARTPGYRKWRKQWRAWSVEEECKDLKMIIELEVGSELKMRCTPYEAVYVSMQKAECAMECEEKAKREAKKKAEDAKEAIHRAAMMYHIYWPEAIEQARKKKAKKEGVPISKVEV